MSITDDRFNEIARELSYLSQSKQVMFQSIIQSLEAPYTKMKPVSFDEFKEYITELRSRYEDPYFEMIKRWVGIAPRCPECKQNGENIPLTLSAIKIPKGPGNLNGYKSVLRCTECTYEEYSKKKVQQQLKSIAKKMHNERIDVVKEWENCNG